MPHATTLRIARQPIFDRNGSVFGYELLYRDGVVEGAGHVDAQTRTTGSVEALIEIGIERLVGKSKAFLNVDFDVIDCPIFEAVSPDQLVLEVLESTEPTEVNLQAVRHLKERGYMIALDDYCFQPHLAEFLPLADIVKLECSALDPEADRLRICKLAAKKKVLAEKVEDNETYRTYRDMGCQLFQGYFFAKPRTMEGSTISSNKASLLMLLTKLNDANVTLAEIESIVASDVSFTYKLLKIIHSASAGLDSRVKTVREAILYLGLRPTASLASLYLASASKENPEELFALALARGRMCEELARKAGLPEAEAYFSVGLLSVLDAFLNRPMAEIVDSLPLTEEMQKALTDPSAEKDLGGALRCAMAFEKGEFDEADRIGFGQEAAQEAYNTGVEWAEATRDSLWAA
jgi:c-di-GMP phosphodiesterase